MAHVIKTSGNVERFDKTKLIRSLRKSGLGRKAAEDILNSISGSIYNGMTTRQIYKLAYAELKKAGNAHAARYNLRTALQMLGPDGFFFEKFVARLFSEEGYETVTNLTLKGNCVTHEVDVALKKGDAVGFLECKFHNSRAATCDVKVPMYILSRYNDLKGRRHSIFSSHDLIAYCTIVTNNRFTEDAKTFARCCGLGLLSWDYPAANSISDKIDSQGLYPVTCLSTLTMMEKEKLLYLDLIMAREILQDTAALKQIGLSDNRIKNIIKEASELCNLR